MDIGSFVGDDVLPVVYSIKRRILKIPFLRGDFFIEKFRKKTPSSKRSVGGRWIAKKGGDKINAAINILRAGTAPGGATAVAGR
jgi:hypothetical protein